MGRVATASTARTEGVDLGCRAGVFSTVGVEAGVLDISPSR